jgi:hypothetical protein
MIQLSLPTGSKRITKQNICDDLGITMVSLMSAIYSGRLPNPTDVDTWEEDHVRFYVENWRKSINGRHEKLSVSCVKDSYPVHTR